MGGGVVVVEEVVVVEVVEVGVVEERSVEDVSTFWICIEIFSAGITTCECAEAVWKD